MIWIKKKCDRKSFKNVSSKNLIVILWNSHKLKYPSVHLSPKLSFKVNSEPTRVLWQMVNTIFFFFFFKQFLGWDNIFILNTASLHLAVSWGPYGFYKQSSFSISKKSFLPSPHPLAMLLGHNSCLTCENTLFTQGSGKWPWIWSSVVTNKKSRPTV